MSDLSPEDTLKLQAEAMKSLGTRLRSKLDTFKTDRRQREIQAMKDLRQYRGEYDPEIKSELDDERSKVYPRDTRLKLLGFSAQMMEMMFPAQEKNWTIAPSKNPNIAAEDVQTLIEQLKQSGEPVTQTAIQTAVRALAKERARAMEDEIEDQLQDLKPDYPSLCKHTVHSGGLYGIGVVAGPFTLTETETEWVQDEQGKWVAKEVEVLRPTLERRRFWDIYPDLSAKTWNTQEGLFDRQVLSRHQLIKLTARKDFFGDAIKAWLRNHTEGNYSAESYDSDLATLDDTSNVKNLNGRRYELYRYLGFISAKELSAIGVSVKESELHKDLLCDIWLLDDIIVKAAPAGFGEHVGHHYHPYLYNDEEEAGLTGVSLPQDVRDSQMKLCAVDRMTMDNGATCCGPITQVDESRLSTRRGPQSTKVHAFSTVYVDRSENPQDPTDPVKAIQITSHIPELLALRKQVEGQFDLESGIPSWTMGASPEKLGEAFRTSGNMSQMRGGASVLTKDQVRAFDRFTTSVIESMVAWNMTFNDKKEIKGDFQVVARGSGSLVAKEIRGAALDQMMQTLDPRERAIIKTRDNLIERFRSRDLPVDNIMSEEEAAQALAQYDQQQAQAAQAQNDNLTAKTQKDGSAAQLNAAKAAEIQATTQAKVGELVAKAEGIISKAKGEQHGAELETLRLILDQIGQAAGAGGEAGKGASAAG